MILGIILSFFSASSPPDSASEVTVAPLLPVASLEAEDTPNDAGQSIDLFWSPSPDSVRIERYEIFRGESPQGPYTLVGDLVAPAEAFNDADSVVMKNNTDYYYKVDAISVDGARATAITSKPVQAKGQWFHMGRLVVLVIAVLYGILVLLYIEFAKRDKNMYIRRIAGLDAVDEAVGRSTEMGKPILFNFGLAALTDLTTLAALSILRRVAKRAAEYGTKLIVPNYDPIVMTAAQETVKQAFAEAGRPDLYREDDITFLTTDQFGYAAGVDGIIIREKPGTIFLQGTFYAEALIFAETGYSVGAIQIAGTTMVTQLPFFVAACDYTLLGEEMYAASAYIDRDPQFVGSIKSEDVAKIAIIIFLVLAVLVGTVGAMIPLAQGQESNWFTKVFDWLVNLFVTS